MLVNLFISDRTAHSNHRTLLYYVSSNLNSHSSNLPVFLVTSRLSITSNSRKSKPNIACSYDLPLSGLCSRLCLPSGTGDETKLWHDECR